MGERSNNTPLRAVVHSNWMAQQSGDGDEMDDTKGTETKTLNFLELVVKMQYN